MVGSHGPIDGTIGMAHSMEITQMLEQKHRHIEALRREAYEVKDCFTRHSFQAVAVAVIALGAIAGLQVTSALLGLLASFPILLLLCVASMGTHKYSTANRLLGYELHLQRTAHYADSSERRWKGFMINIGWEEAMRAWRVVQASIFEHVYKTRGNSRKNARSSGLISRVAWRFRPETLQSDIIFRSELVNFIRYASKNNNAIEQMERSLDKQGIDASIRTNVVDALRDTNEYDVKVRAIYGHVCKDNKKREALRSIRDTLEVVKGPHPSLWFEPKSLLNDTSVYYAGGYLRTMMRVIGATILACILMMIIALVQFHVGQEYMEMDQGSKSWILSFMTLYTSTVIAATCLRWAHLRARVEILENGLLSIHSSAIVWEVTVVAHYLALRKLGARVDNVAAVRSLSGYTSNLSTIVTEILLFDYDIHQWLDHDRIVIDQE